MKRTKVNVVVVRVAGQWRPQSYLDTPPEAAVERVAMRSVGIPEAIGLLFGFNGSAMKAGPVDCWLLLTPMEEVYRPGDKVKDLCRLSA